jgi:non-haem dioxygenase in morphine synthesis N-terminal
MDDNGARLCLQRKAIAGRKTMTALTTLSTTTVAPPDMVHGVIPVLDVGPFLAGAPGARGRLGGQLRFAFEHVGFYYLRGHGVPQSLIDATFATAARFHAQPLEQKLAVKVSVARQEVSKAG